MKKQLKLIRDELIPQYKELSKAIQDAYENDQLSQKTEDVADVYIPSTETTPVESSPVETTPIATPAETGTIINVTETKPSQALVNDSNNQAKELAFQEWSAALNNLNTARATRDTLKKWENSIPKSLTRNKVQERITKINKLLGSSMVLNDMAKSNWDVEYSKLSTAAKKTLEGIVGSAHADANTAINKYEHSVVDKLKKKYDSLDTGGYTGTWGSNEGRLALLHQKELVLNADDTKNMLTLMNLTRDLISNIDSLRHGVKTTSMYNTSNIASGETVNMTIHANFPNANDSKQIELAFNNLKARASQVANKR